MANWVHKGCGGKVVCHIEDMYCNIDEGGDPDWDNVDITYECEKCGAWNSPFDNDLTEFAERRS